MDPTILVGDIVEHDSAKKPKPPTDFSDDFGDPTGFPQHKRRWKGASAFKQRRAGQATKTAAATNTDASEAPTSSTKAPDAAPLTFSELERQRIDEENRQKMDDMTPEEIAEAQREIMNGLNPDLVQRLLRRATIDDTGTLPEPQPQPKPQAHQTTVESDDEQDTPDKKPSKVRFAEDTKPADEAKVAPAKPGARALPADFDEDAPPREIPPDLFPVTDLPTSTHFPAPPRQRDLDPSDPDFLQTLHSKYFPDLPADPSKMAWMAPVPSEDSVADRESPYYPHAEIAVSALRFDFRGRFLSPRLSRALPVSMGLHHHGQAPEAAGYTIAELALLARSAVPAQRCMAFQTLGRVLYRLGKGEWGTTLDDPIAMGVWEGVKAGRVIETLSEAAGREDGHRGSQAYATEALWLFEKGGWKDKFKGR